MTKGFKPPNWTPRDVANVLFRRKAVVIGVFAMCAGAAALTTAMLDNTYRSDAKILIRVGRASVGLDPTATTGGHIISVHQTRTNEINSEIEILTSRRLAGRVVDAINPGALLNPTGRPIPSPTVYERERAVEILLRNLDVHLIRDSNVIGVSFRAGHPRLAHLALRTLTDYYLEEHILAHRTYGSHQFFVREAGRQRAELHRIEKALKEVKNEMGVASVESQILILSALIGQVEQDLATTEAAIAASRGRLRVYSSEVETLPDMHRTAETSGIPGTAVETLRGRLNELRVEEQDLLSRYRPESVVVLRIRQQIEEVAAILADQEQTHREVTFELNANRVQIELAAILERGNLASLEETRTALEAKLTASRGRLEALNEAEYLLNALHRDREIIEASFRDYANRLEHTRVDSALEEERISNISVVQDASLPSEPIGPNRKLILALGLFLGMTGGPGSAFLCDFLARSFYTTSDVERKLGLPALAAIPRSPDPAVRLRSKDGHPATIAPPERQLNFDLLRERLMLAGEGKLHRSIGIMGATSGAGASVVASNLAVALALSGDGPCLLLDANIERPSLHRDFGQPLSPGFGELMGGTADGAERRLPVAALDLVPAGRPTRDVPPSLQVEAFRRLVEEWKKRYRVVLCDLPTVSEAAVAARMAAQLDGVLVVIEAERSRYEAVERTRELLTKAGAMPLGVVLNKRGSPIPRLLYERL